jgi:uncharacterized membrane protein YphA (DoxX/SURF4 family)
MKVIRIISRIFVALVFIFSGFVKAVDPLGSTYKFADYFRAFGMEWAEPLAFVLAIVLSGAEFLIGVGLLFNVLTKLFSWLALLFMAFFTPLTLILALYNPVSDCGCFGDALVLTNWQTFGKNIIILIPTLILFFTRKQSHCHFTKLVQWSVTGIFAFLITGISIYCYNHLPLIDFLPYKVGTYIPDKMKFPENAQPDVYETIFYYKNLKTGEVKEFDQNNYPWQDTLNWKWQDSKSVLVKEGYHPPIHDFLIESPENGDITDIVLNDDTCTFLLVAYNINKTSKKNIEAAKNLDKFCKENRYRFYMLTASSDVDIQKFQTSVGSSFNFCFTDETTLKTMVRANPGLLLLKKGTILGKWHSNDIPAIDELKAKYLK